MNGDKLRKLAQRIKNEDPYVKSSKDISLLVVILWRKR